MNNKFVVDLPKEMKDVFIQIALAGLCFFSAFELIRNADFDNKFDLLDFVIVGILICFFITFLFFTVAAIKSLIRHFSSNVLEILLCDNRIEVPCYVSYIWCFSEIDKNIINFESISNVSLKGSLYTNTCWVKILYLDNNKLKKLSISKTIFKSSKIFEDFIAQLNERNLLTE